MNGYEYSSTGNPFTSRGNGSAYELFNMNPALFGIGNFGTQSNPTTTTPYGSPQSTQPQQPYTQQGNPMFQQNPNPAWQQQSNPFGQQQFNPFWQQQGNPFWQQSMQQPWQSQQNQPGFTGSWPWQPQYQQQQFGPGTMPHTNSGVYTTKAVDVNLTFPAQSILGRNPIEVQQYVLHVVVPTLLDALTKRAIAHDVGQSISYDLRGCVAKVGV